MKSLGWTVSLLLTAAVIVTAWVSALNADKQWREEITTNGVPLVVKSVKASSEGTSWMVEISTNKGKICKQGNGTIGYIEENLPIIAKNFPKNLYYYKGEIVALRGYISACPQ